MAYSASSDEVFSQISELSVLPVVVLEKIEDALLLADTFVSTHLAVAEVTFRTSQARDCIYAMSSNFPELLVGAGTVVTLEQAQAAVDAGARFIVSPGTNDEVVRWCLQNDIFVVPGALTPTEIMHARDLGVSTTKFFPSGNFGGINTLKSLGSVFKQHAFVPTGGVSLANLAEYLALKNVAAVGGTWIAKPELINRKDFEQIASIIDRTKKVIDSSMR